MQPKPVSDRWERGDPYERYIGRWSRELAPRFLAWINLPAYLRWLDVGCGTGALCSAVVDTCSPVMVAGVEPSACFRKTAEENLAGRVRLYAGSAVQIPLDGASVDVVVSGLVLNFITDAHAALIEMARVTRDAGTVAAYVWDYAGKMELIRYFWDAAIEVDTQAARLDEGARFPLCHPEALMRLFASAGFSEIETAAIDIQTPFASFEDYWQPFLGGQGPAPAYLMSLDEETRTRLKNRLRNRIPVQPGGSISMTARAWAVRATVIKSLGG